MLITGARRGIGLDVAGRLAARGHTVYATVHRAESIEPTWQTLRQCGPLVSVDKLDLLSAPDRRHAAEWSIDVLINNAALSEGGPLLDIGLDHVQRVLQTNVLGTLALIQAVVPGMLERKRPGARVVIVGSIMGVIPTPYRAPYGMSKWALENLAHSLRAELEPFGIPVIMVNPGAYATGFNRESAERAYAWMALDSPFRPPMEKAEARVARIEVDDTDGIAEQIVRAVEDEPPKHRYVAPWWQWIGRPR